MFEYRVTSDVSTKGDNNPEAIAKKINEMAADGWRLSKVTSFADIRNVSRVYCFFERERNDK